MFGGTRKEGCQPQSQAVLNLESSLGTGQRRTFLTPQGLHSDLLRPLAGLGMEAETILALGGTQTYY